MYLSFPYSIDN